MSKKICIAQSVPELKFILNKVNEPIICVPLSLHTQLYCIKNKFQFYNPINFIDNSFHRSALIESENLINNLNFGDLQYESHKKVYADYIRYKFHSIIFIMELIEKIDTFEKIDEIFVSGWNGNVSEFSKENYIVSYIISNLITNIKVIRLSERDEKLVLGFFSSGTEKKYAICNINLNVKKNYILQNSTDYNFWRTFFYVRKKNYCTLIPVFHDHRGQTLLSFLKRKILRLFNVIFIEFRGYPNKEQKKIHFPNINFFYKEKNLSNVLNLRNEDVIVDLNDLRSKCEAINVLFDKVNIKLVLSNMVVEVHGYYIEKAKKNNIPSITVPHGTISEYFNKFDKIFKRHLADLHFTKQSKFFAIQSKIAKNFVNAYKINNNCIETGNLLFSNNKKSTKKKILFAVTLKEFKNIKYLGIDMYYEFIENLSLLNDIAKRTNLRFMVKPQPHPSMNKSFNDLKEKFNNLEFTKQKIDKALRHAFVTISFSSTVIEDSLCSSVPVILFDRWKRYKHCRAEENVKKKNSAIYYVSNEKDLINCINTVRESNKISFKEYVFDGDVKLNMKKLMQKLL